MVEVASDAAAEGDGRVEKTEGQAAWAALMQHAQQFLPLSWGSKFVAAVAGAVRREGADHAGTADAVTTDGLDGEAFNVCYGDDKAPRGNPHIQFDVPGSGVELLAMVDSGAALGGAIPRKLADELEASHPGVVTERKVYEKPIWLSGIDKKGKGKGAHISGELKLTLELEGRTCPLPTMSVVEEASMGRADFILGNRSMYLQGASVNYDTLTYDISMPDDGLGLLRAKLRFFDKEGGGASKAAELSASGLGLAPQHWSESTYHEKAAELGRMLTGDTTDVKADEHVHACAAKAKRPLAVLMLCLAASSLTLLPHAQQEVPVVLRIDGHAVPKQAFTVSGLPAVNGIGSAPDVLMQTRLDGTADVALMNSSESPMAFSKEEALAFATWIPAESIMAPAEGLELLEDGSDDQQSLREVLSVVESYESQGTHDGPKDEGRRAGPMLDNLDAPWMSFEAAGGASNEADIYDIRPARNLCCTWGGINHENGEISTHEGELDSLLGGDPLSGDDLYSKTFAAATEVLSINGFIYKRMPYGSSTAVWQHASESDLKATTRAVPPSTSAVPFHSGLPVKHEASLADVKSGQYHIESIDSSVWDDPHVIPVVVLYSGMGGMTMGINDFKDADDKYYTYVVALAIDNSTDALSAHRINSPQVPLAQHTLGSKGELMALLEKHLPRKHWGKMWVHASNSCREASTVNRRRNIEAARRQTDTAIQLMQSLGPAIWTLENSEALFQFYRGNYETARVVQMRHHAPIAAERSRLILSNRQLVLPLLEGAAPSVRDVLGDRKGWKPDERRLMRQSYGSIRSVDEAGFTVTGGMHHIGNRTTGDAGLADVPSAEDRALLVGFDSAQLPVFPSSMSEGTRRGLVADVIPPLFARVMHDGVHSFIRTHLGMVQLNQRLQRVAEMTEAEAKVFAAEMQCSRLEHAQVEHEAPLPTEPQLSVGTTHGRWQFWGHEYGWNRMGEGIEPLAKRLRFRPWLRIDQAPRPEDCMKEWWKQQRQIFEERAVSWMERYEMAEHDRVVTERPTKPIPGTFVNVAPNLDEKGLWCSNSQLQKEQPEWYGPYLDEGKCYKTPRTGVNVDEACTKMGLDELTDEACRYKSEIRRAIYDNWLLFDGEMREIKGVKVDMDMGGAKPIRVHPYRWSPAKTEIAKKLIDEFVEDGLLSPINSPWGFGAVVVPKPGKPGQYRLCIDLRPLNELLPRDNYEPPSCDLCLEWLAGRRYRTSLDCRWGFHQVGITDRAKRILCLNTSIGTYCFNRLVMGHLNATAEFQRHINYTLGDSLWTEALSMVDDVIIANEELPPHITSLRRVLTKLAERHHSIKPEKMQILRTQLEYLGHVSTPDGTLISDKHKTAIVNMPYPIDELGRVSRTQVRSFLGLVQYCRRYIPKSANICAPLNELTSEQAQVEWGPVHAAAWDMLKYHIAHNKGVWHINYRYPIYVTTDGSKTGIGGYIWQLIDGEERVVSYYSRKTTRDEQKWDTRELEVLALITTMEHFHMFLDGQKFHVQSDHMNIKWLLQQKQLSGRLARWVIRLSAYDFDLEFKAGKRMHVADCMSRNSVDVGVIELTPGTYELAFEETEEEAAEAEAERRSIKEALKEEVYTADYTPAGLRDLAGALAPMDVTLERIRQATADDAYAKSVVAELGSGGETPLAKRFALMDGVLYHFEPGKSELEAEPARVYAPESVRPALLHNFHNSIYGTHRNWRATYDDLAERYWWNGMQEAVREHVRTCRECQLAKGMEPKKQGRLFGYRHFQSMQQLNMDLVGPITVGRASHTTTDDDPTYILTVTDPFSHMVWLECISNKTAKEVYAKFCERILLEEGAPRVVVTDNGREFDNHLLRGLMEYARVEHRWTPAYHPRANYAERVNRFVGAQLRAMVNAPGVRKADWPRLVKYIEFAYRRTLIPGTQVSPFMVARGRQPMLPVDADLLDSAAVDPSGSPVEEVEQMKHRIKFAEKLVLEAREKVMANNKETFDVSQLSVSFEVGDLVRLFRQTPAVRDPATGMLDSSKLRLRNSVWRVAERRGQTYTLVSEVTGKTTEAHVSQISRFYVPSALPTDASVVPQPAAQTDSNEELLAQVKVGHYIAFHDRDLPADVIHVGEVLDVEADGSIVVWYLYDGSQSGRKYDPKRPLLQWRSEPEWYNPKTGGVVARPSEQQKLGLSKRMSTLLPEEIDVIVPSFDAHRRVGGGFSPLLTAKVDRWLRSHVSNPKKLLKVLSEPTTAEQQAGA